MQATKARAAWKAANTDGLFGRRADEPGARDEPARTRHVTPVVVTESLDELRFLGSGPDDEERQRREARQRDEPVRRREGVRKEREGGSDVDKDGGRSDMDRWSQACARVW